MLERQRFFMKPSLGFFNGNLVRGLQLQHSLNEPQPKLFCYQCKSLTYFSRWKLWYNEIAMSSGDHSNPRNHFSLQEKTKENIFLFPLNPGSRAQEMREGKELPLPSSNQPKHLQIDSRTEINSLPHDRWQSTDSSNPSLNCFAVKSEGWTMTMWARRILNRTFNKHWGLNF